jgi:hypothetical protein
MGTIAAMPTNMTCGLTFAPDVVGKNNEQVCAPPDGRPASCDTVNIDQCEESCTAGDVSAFTFKTEPLTVRLGNGLSDGQTGVSRTDDVSIQTIDTVPVDAGQIATIQVFEGAAMTPYTQFTVALNSSNPSNSEVLLHWTNATGLAANTVYKILIPTAFQDSYHVGLPAAQTFTITTGT